MEKSLQSGACLTDSRSMRTWSNDLREGESACICKWWAQIVRSDWQHCGKAACRDWPFSYFVLLATESLCIISVRTVRSGPSWCRNIFSLGKCTSAPAIVSCLTGSCETGHKASVHCADTSIYIHPQVVTTSNEAWWQLCKVWADISIQTQTKSWF